MPTPKRPTRPPRAASPPNRVDPGWFHEALADGLLKLTKKTVDDVTPEGVEFVAGDLKAVEEVIPTESREPVDLLARIIAHVFHRIPGLKRVEKRLEGSELKAGVGSDLLAFAAQIFNRNKHLIPVIVDAVQTAQRNQAAAKATASQIPSDRERPQE